MKKEDFGNKIKKIRKQKGYTQAQLAEMANISTNFYGEIERGKKIPRVDIFTNIIIALDIPADYILRDILPSGKQYVYDEITSKLEKLKPKERKIICDIIDIYLKNS